MSEQITRKKNVTGEKDSESNTVTNMLVGPQVEQARASGINQDIHGGNKDTNINQNQGDSVNPKNLGSISNSNESVKTKDSSSKNQGDSTRSGNLDSTQEKTIEGTNNPNPKSSNAIIITEDLVDD
ncbi:uncharacterized protein MELLADRAFT_69404 [Melampsora larici-populina 98AG31]|uniref:Uncharacterized protein n=1 Tax=Melampsora larici-populina (strain 98AG31 / pathotype 3-4-7) TaxID=747676 RepID=F4SAK5_MELLP|nr:uncharacterized protein MELLADRAFT_69404 [Melampsora larici-populina 98AG31]EGF98321.1 hypothetical protein MELLADRAFT_69404 [Melampsora larici-populina 98AG31]